MRNYEARNNLIAMKKGDLALYYHSNQGKEVVGIAEIIGESYPDPTTDDERWVVVDVAPLLPFSRPVSLAAIKAEPSLEAGCAHPPRPSVGRSDHSARVSLYCEAR